MRNKILKTSHGKKVAYIISFLVHLGGGAHFQLILLIFPYFNNYWAFAQPVKLK